MFLNKKHSKLIKTLFCAFCCIFIFLKLIGLVFNIRVLSTFAANNYAETYKVRSELLMEAMNSVGACDPEKAAQIWAQGLKMRSGAMQYSALSRDLKEKYAKDLEENAPNWVTGISSPWVEDYSIISTTEINDSYMIQLEFQTMTSTGPAESYKALLTIRQEDGYWQIFKLSADPGLYPYTLFNPE